MQVLPELLHRDPGKLSPGCCSFSRLLPSQRPVYRQTDVKPVAAFAAVCCGIRGALLIFGVGAWKPKAWA